MAAERHKVGVGLREHRSACTCHCFHTWGAVHGETGGIGLSASHNCLEQQLALELALEPELLELFLSAC